ncbi:MAG: response regulator transcription factor [Deltaproteobacteria bacterium]|nr:response regulator transcription factor [Deltaproteobacteria bacterium]
MQRDNIRVLVVDDHAVVRHGIRSLLEAQEGMQVVGEAATGREAVEKSKELNPDVVLMDLVMPDIDGVEAIVRIRSAQPQIPILVLTGFGSDDKLFPAIKAGAVGYLLKDTNPRDLVWAVQQAAEGLTTLTPSVARRLLAEFSHEPKSEPLPESLTEREVEVLRHLALGLRNGDIAERLYISDTTVRGHVRSILAKLGLINRTQAALYALREGLASLDDLPS